ncbi:hypothetical protein V9Z70_09795 [Streptococcus suis]|uniref:hypothetical protein n=1 Tax=Streptococcus suis TaxID=1307 RepID=UPI0015573346|nr:hypothetical protein [Streptococcus suis]NQM16504.1 hypothetical protein [Streptococcus suis]NQR20907.1 hypothetical protein [Streptococcus suis]HEL2196366.1 hypothetical protein [Streptococcus suis]HEM2778706.1 hypothetical protein [Streptococcus suis]
MEKWVNENIWNIFSNIISLISLIASIYLAIKANKVAKDLAKQSDSLSNLGIELARTANDIAIHSSLLKFEPNIDVHRAKSSTILMGKDELSGTTLSISGALSLEHGKIAQVYLINKDSGISQSVDFISKTEKIYSSEKKFLANKVEVSHKFELNNLGNTEIVSGNFYIVIIDETFKLHRLLLQIVSDSDQHSGSYIATLEVNSVRKPRNIEVFYRIFTDLDFIEYENIENRTEWINTIKQTSETNYGRRTGDRNSKLDSYKKIDYKELVDDIEKINKHFEYFGFKR